MPKTRSTFNNFMIFKIWYKNISNDGRAVQEFEFYRGGSDGVSEFRHRQDVQPGQEIEYTFDLSDAAGYYKLNGNVLPR